MTPQKKFTNIKVLLNEIKWTKDISNIKIFYIHRGAENDTKTICGDEIIAIHAASLDTKNATIPYHRIHTIFYGSALIFKRKNTIT